MNRTPNKSFFIQFPRDIGARVDNACMVTMRDRALGWGAYYWAKENGPVDWVLIGNYPDWEDAARAAQVAFDMGLPEPR